MPQAPALKRVPKLIVVAICLSLAAVSFLLAGWPVAALVCFAAAVAVAAWWQIGEPG